MRSNDRYFCFYSPRQHAIRQRLSECRNRCRGAEPADSLGHCAVAEGKCPKTSALRQPDYDSSRQVKDLFSA
jgi:hypothetical protein